MIVRLRNLVARPPAANDLEAVTALMIACDLAESGIADTSREDVWNNWQVATFSLKSDAWVIVTNKGEIVGYAEVRRCGEQQIASLQRVHPDYQRRGIGTLLIWLTEERARQLMRTISPELQVTLTNVVNSLNQCAQHLFEREGYRAADRFWRLVILAEEGEEQALEDFYHNSALKVDIVATTQGFTRTTHLAARTGIYSMHQYHVFEKELRAGKEKPVECELTTQYITV